MCCAWHEPPPPPLPPTITITTPPCSCSGIFKMPLREARVHTNKLIFTRNYIAGSLPARGIEERGSQIRNQNQGNEQFSKCAELGVSARYNNIASRPVFVIFSIFRFSLFFGTQTAHITGRLGEPPTMAGRGARWAVLPSPRAVEMPALAFPSVWNVLHRSLSFT